jgi:long-chain acyl-CoA synthetase
MDVVQEIQAVFDKHENRVFLIDTLADRQFTYREFYRLACSAAALLYEHGIRRQDRVVLLLNNSAEFAALYFGCLFLGAAAVPVNPVLHPNEVAFIVRHSGAKLIIFSPATDRLFNQAASSGPHLLLLPLHECDASKGMEGEVLFNAPGDMRMPPNTPLAGVHEDDLFSITFTSGTTSQPKGVAHRIKSLLKNAAAFDSLMGFHSANRFLHVMSMSYMAGFLNTLLCPFMSGASIVLCRVFDAQTALKFWHPVIDHRVDTFWLAPTMLAVLLKVDRNADAPDYCRKYVKTICIGTAPLPLKIKRAFEQRYGVELLESYGLSELLLVSGNANRYPRSSGSVGRPLPDVEVSTVDENGRLIEGTKGGEILIRTPYLMTGYLNYETGEPDIVSRDDWFPTGDIGYVGSNGDLFVSGRRKDLIIRGGLNISPRAVEEALENHEAVDKAAVIGLPDDIYGEEVLAVLKLNSGYALTNIQESLVVFCRKTLSPISVPSRFMELSEFPISSTGKIQKAKLREIAAATLNRKE